MHARSGLVLLHACLSGPVWSAAENAKKGESSIGSSVSSAATPPVINATCAAALDAWCNDIHLNGACINDLRKVFPDCSPLVGLWAPECGSFVGSGANETCGPGPPKPAAWRCYSHLALDARRRWDGVHPTGCTRPELEQVYAKCMGLPTPPPPAPPAPPPPVGPTFTGPMHDVFYPGLQPEVRAAHMESCYRIPSLLYVPPSSPTAAVAHDGALLAVAESKHGTVCGDGVNSTLMMRRSTDFGSSWGPAFPPFLRWESDRKWGQPQMTYDAVTGSALLMFSNETLSKSPGGTQSLGSVLQIASTNAGVTWTSPRDAQRVDQRDASYPTGPAPTSGNGIQLRPGHGHAGRLIFSMDTAGYTGDQLLLSDDHGRTYSPSYALNRSTMNEVQLAQVGNGSVLAVMRNRMEGHRQAVAISNDGGESFGPIRAHPQLVTPTCQGSVLFVGGTFLPVVAVAASHSPLLLRAYHYRFLGTTGSTVLYAGPYSPSSRVQMTVLASDDNGDTFNRSLRIWSGTSMYSSMQLLPTGEVALLFERDGGNTSLVRFNASDLQPPPGLRRGVTHH